MLAEPAPKVIDAGKLIVDLWQSAGGIIAAAKKTGKVDADAAPRLKALVDLQLAALEAVGGHITGGPEAISWENVPTPEPGQAEVLIRTRRWPELHCRRAWSTTKQPTDRLGAEVFDYILCIINFVERMRNLGQFLIQYHECWLQMDRALPISDPAILWVLK